MSSKITAALIDLSGTLHIEDTVIPGAIDALRRLRQTGVQIRFVSNTTKEPLRTLHDRLSTLGFDIRKEEMFTSLSAARSLVDSRGIRPFLMLEETAKEDFAGVDEENPNAVVIGLAPSKFNYETMDKAFRLLLNGAQLIAIHKGRYYQKKDGLSLGPGPFVAGLEFASGAKAEIVGKPEKGFFEEALRLVNSTPSRTVMIGDDVKDDVAGAMNAGLLGILVKTETAETCMSFCGCVCLGKYREGDESTITPSPSFVCSDFPSAVDLLLKEYLI